MTRRSQIATVATFLTALVLPLVLLVAGVRPEMTDNRIETAAPDLSGDAVLQLETYEQLTGFLTDRLPLRDHAIGAERRSRPPSSTRPPARASSPGTTAGSSPPPRCVSGASRTRKWPGSGRTSPR